MIPAGRVQKCHIHGLEYDATISAKCPACRERDKREELEAEARQAVQLNHQLIQAIAPVVAALMEAGNDD